MRNVPSGRDPVSEVGTDPGTGTQPTHRVPTPPPAPQPPSGGAAVPVRGCAPAFTGLSVSTGLTGLGEDEASTTPGHGGCLRGALSPGMPGRTRAVLSRGSREDCVPPAAVPTPTTGTAPLQLRALPAPSGSPRARGPLGWGGGCGGLCAGGQSRCARQCCPLPRQSSRSPSSARLPPRLAVAGSF